METWGYTVQLGEKVCKLFNLECNALVFILFKRKKYLNDKSILNNLIVFWKNCLAAELLLYGKFVLTDRDATTVLSIQKTAYLLCTKSYAGFRTY